MIWWVIGITAIAGVVGTGLGGAIGTLFNKDSNKVISLLLAFAGGIMIAVVCFDLIYEAISAVTQYRAGILIAIVGVLGGFFVVYLLNYIIDRHTKGEVEHIDEVHPKTADDLDELIHSDHLVKHRQTDGEKGKLFIAGIVMACAIALHNMPEGMAIGASLAIDADNLSLSGIALATVIALHNIPEGMAVSVPLIAGDTNKGKAIAITALCGAPTIIGAVIGFGLGMLNPVWLCISLSFASGAMLYVVLGELLPESILMWKSKLPAVATLLGMLVGLAIVFI